MNIEIIDDNEQLAISMEKSFKKKSHNTRVFNSRDAFLHTSRFDADLYIMDINLGDGNGLDLIEHLRVVEKVTNPIIIISGQTRSGTKDEGFAVGADDFIEKPFSMTNLYERIDSIFSHITTRSGDDCGCEKKPLYSCLSEKEKAKLFNT